MFLKLIYEICAEIVLIIKYFISRKHKNGVWDEIFRDI